MTYEAYLEQNALLAAQEHFAKAAARGLESMGLLAGSAAKWRGQTYAIADEFITAGNSATSVSVKFEQESFPQLAAKVNEARKKGKVIVSWCHSHPNYGCFLSSTDVATQRKYFGEEFNFALVIDPVRNEKQAFKLSEENESGYRTASYAIIRRK